MLKLSNKLTFRISTLLSVTLIMFCAGLAFAQVVDGGTEENFVNGTVNVVQDTAHSIRQIAGDTKSPKVLIVLVVLMGIAQLVRRVGRKIPIIKGFDLGGWLNGHWWADWVVSLTLSIGGAIVAQVTSGQPVDVALIVNAIVLGMAGAGFGPKGGVPTSPPPPVSDAVKKDAAAAAEDPSKQLNG